jgi:arylsulfatase A-like enzyme
VTRSLRTLAPLALAAAILTAAATPGAAQDAPPPNVVLIVVDDLGWADLSAQGSTYYETPHIDGLAAQGVRFTNAYAAASICSPSRAALLTGRYPARIGITDWIRAEFQGGTIPADRRNPSAYVADPGFSLLTPPNPLWMEHEEVTLAELLKGAGYATAHIGKWHLGGEGWLPETQGFELNLGGSDYGQPPSYFDPYHREGQGDLGTLRPRRPGEYLTDREADEAATFIRAHRDRPFFLHLAHYAVHTPLQAPEELEARYAGKPKGEQKNPRYAAMVHSVDQAVGRILGTLEEEGLTGRTLVIFTSDNGGLLGPTSNAPLRSGKGFPYEGGLRVPLMARWPGVIPQARVSHEPVIGMDLLPTIAAAAGVPLPEGRVIDGVSLLDHLRSGAESALERDALFWHFPHYRERHTVPPYSVMRRGDWKLVKWHEGPTFELYDLLRDPAEEADLAASRPELVREMDELLSAWLREVGARMPRPNPEYRPAPGGA